jgi:hypothetical protein
MNAEKQKGMELVRFEPGTYIEIDDTMKGFRKLARVAEGGTMYYDEVSAEATPFPIYSALKPEGVGDALAWGLRLAEKDQSEHAKYTALQEQMQDAGWDTLSIARGLYWAYSNRVYDFARASAATKAANEEVRQSREMMDRLIRKGAAA